MGLKKDDIIGAIHEGMFNAHDQFEILTNGEWITDPGVKKAEGFVVSHIFRTISRRVEYETPLLELPVRFIKDWSGASARGRPNAAAGLRRRPDITILNKIGRPIYACEVKLKWGRLALQDVEKLRALLTNFGPRRDGTLKSVFLSVYWQRTNRPSLEDKMKEVQDNIQTWIDGSVKLDFSRRVCATMREGKTREYGSHVIILSRRNRSRN